MANVITYTFKDYTRTRINFDRFHNQVINMPRATFSEIPELIKLLKSLASYILLIDEEILKKPMNPKKLYEHIFLNYKKGLVPSKNRNLSFESTFLNINDTFDRVYENVHKMGRRFRHYTELFSFFNIFQRIKKDGKWHKQLCVFDVDSLKELELTDEQYLMDVFRNRLLNLNVKDNSHIVNCKGIELSNDADYRPARAIIRYMYEMKRDVTDFEIAVLLGRIDEVQKENEILIRANKIGRELPYSLDQQINLFFQSMLWKSSGGVQFTYSSSQEPYFKFKVFLIMMETFELVEYDRINQYIKLTDYSKKIASQDVSLDILDLEHLLAMIDNGTEDTNKLTNIIINKRTDAITKAIQDDGELVEKLNIRSIHYPIIKNNKRVRNRLIMEVSKIKADYLDEVTGKAPFAGKTGKSYVEAHHILEFSRENGPDITDNLICLGPENHMLIHHGSKDEIDAFFATCKNKGLIDYNRFEKICLKYHCLTPEHVKTLYKKGILNAEESQKLNNLISINGIDSIFLETLNIKAAEV
ncbi:hnh endonuclease [Coprobacillus sp. CAG:698]|nr:hnh endonuclease [Coprobacillus sp. CAG:698]